VPLEGIDDQKHPRVGDAMAGSVACESQHPGLSRHEPRPTHPAVRGTRLMGYSDDGPQTTSGDRLGYAAASPQEDLAMTNLIRPPVEGEVELIKKLAIDTNLFGIEEVGFFDETLAGFFDGSLEDNYWLVVEDTDSQVIAAAYFAPEPFSDRMWNLYFIAVAPEHQGRGLGASLMQAAEEQLRSSGEDVARVLIVETSSTDQYAQTRTFYQKLGYDEEARIRQFYGPSDDKVVFWKSLLAGP